MSFAIRNAEAGDWEAVRLLLSEANLPVADLDAGRMRDFLVAEAAHGDIIGAVGVECYARDGLLRSLVIGRAARQAGIGRALVERIEARSATEGVVDMWLLTIDVPEFFVKLGYLRRERVDVPSAIAGTAEFASLCPDSACLMSRRLR